MSVRSTASPMTGVTSGILNPLFASLSSMSGLSHSWSWSENFDEWTGKRRLAPRSRAAFNVSAWSTWNWYETS